MASDLARGMMLSVSSSLHGAFAASARRSADEIDFASGLTRSFVDKRENRRALRSSC
jgi:hypothetical protein